MKISFYVDGEYREFIVGSITVEANNGNKARVRSTHEDFANDNRISIHPDNCESISINSYDSKAIYLELK